ncbi:hypothetical protein GE09DRAFT_1176508 [Coniochaeta sp. 2T2.1]|nr:hypothetical protein GE09DRAFT_1176508 [Coniochaeta sp. 2T2.1]
MPSLRKRPHEEVSAEPVEPPKSDTPRKMANEQSMLERIRGMWQFANLYQWIMLFGKAIKMDDDFDIEDLEAECLKPFSTKLQDIGLSMLKYLSSHRGLTHDLFDEYSRRQFLAKNPSNNPFGPADEPPIRFADLDVFQKINILQLMTRLIMMNPEKLRERTDEHNVTDQTNWRIEPYGWDRLERTYFVLDDNRVYRMTEAKAPIPAATPKKGSKKGRAAARASKRRRISTAVSSDAGDGGDEDSEDGRNTAAQPEDDGLGGNKWECVAVTLEEVRLLLRWMEKTKDPDEKILRDQLQDHLVPILERQEESKKRKQQQRERELLALEKMAHAKRSSRLAHKLEHQKAEEQAREEERKRREEEAIARKEEQKRQKIERERERRLVSREQRLKEREARRLQHQEELANLSEDSRNVSSGEGRLSGRRLQAEIEKNKQALKEIEEEEDDWIFDCSCGLYGQVDDGSHSVACERCNVWQHSKCLGIKEEDAEREDFHFICDPCRRAQAAPRAIKIKLKQGSSPLANAARTAGSLSSPQAARPAKIVVEIERKSSTTDGSTLMPPDTAQLPGAPSGLDMPRPAKTSGNAFTNHQPLTNGSGSGSNPFAPASHPTLSPPDQSPTKARAYHTLYQSNGAPDQSHTVGNVPPPSTPSVLAPSKQGTATKTTPPVLFPPPGYSSENTHHSVHRPNGTSPVLGAAPQLSPGQSFDDSRPGEKSTPLPPSRGGLSPTKHSPPMSHKQLNGSGAAAASSFSSSFGAGGSGRGSPKASILSPPPAAQLTPSPPQQILTPPVKHSVPAPRSHLLQTHMQNTSSPPRPASEQGASS